VTAHSNLLRDGYEVTAERISKRLRTDGRHRTTVVVRPNGKVRTYRPAECEEPADYVIGTYTVAARVEHIEDDLIVRLREIQASA
jgi:hypothetical protein